MADFLEELKKQRAVEFAQHLQPNPKKCPFTKEQLKRAYEQAVGVMYAYKDARQQKGIDVHHLPRWEECLRHAISVLSTSGVDAFLITYEHSLSSDNAENLKGYPKLKGLETMAKMLRIEIEEPLKGWLANFERWRKKQPLVAIDRAGNSL